MSKRTIAAVPPAPTFPPEVMHNLAKCDPYAVKCLADWHGPQYLNPVIGRTPTETFGNLNDALGFLHTLVRSDDGMNCETYPGLALFIETMWVAAQYEEFRNKQEGESA